MSRSRQSSRPITGIPGSGVSFEKASVMHPVEDCVAFRIPDHS
jgi:hypothetical protein